MYQRKPESNAYLLFHAIYKFDTWNFHRTSLQHCWRRYFAMYSTQLSTLFFHLWTSYVLPTCTSQYKLLSLLYSNWRRTTAPSRHWRNGVTAVSFQMAKQVKMWWWEVMTLGCMRPHTAHSKFVMAHVMRNDVKEDKHFRYFLSWDLLDKRFHSYFLSFQYTGHTSLFCVHKGNTFVVPTDCNHFSSWWYGPEFLLPRVCRTSLVQDVGPRFHSRDNLL